jgi:hypothetical protein
VTAVAQRRTRTEEETRELQAALLAAGLIRVTLADPDLPHQMTGSRYGNSVAVSCNCRRRANRAPLASGALAIRSKWEAAEALAVWREHMEEVTRCQS